MGNKIRFWQDGYNHRMKPGFALSLSFEGISLLHRAAGGWRLVGETKLDVQDLGAALADLRAKAKLLEPQGLSCKVIVPNDQIKYLSVETGDVSPEIRMGMIRNELAASTPYAIDDLAYDLSQEGDTTHVAAVALETLEEAEAFALEHEFNPVGFVAVPGEQPFLGEPFFGPARSWEGETVEPDGIAVVVIGAAVFPEPPAPEKTPETAKPAPATSKETTAETPVPQDDSAQADAPQDPDAAAPPAKTEPAEDIEPLDITPTFSSRRGKPTDESGPKPAIRAQKAGAPAKARPIEGPPPPAVTPPVTPPVKTAPPAPAASAAPVPAPAPGVSGAKVKPVAADTSRTSTAPAQPAEAKSAEPEKPADSETNRMTVFGARAPQEVRGKPRYLGVMLTTLLVLFMIAVAAWATLFSDNGFGVFRSQPEPPTEETAPARPSTEDPQPEAPCTAPETDADSTGADAPPRTSLIDPATLPAPKPVPEPEGLTDEDAAVLEALVDPSPEELESEPEPEDTTELELAALPEAATEGADAPQLDDVARYAATGIWSFAPDQPDTPGVIGLNDLYVASIDRTDLSQDAVALPSVDSLDSDLSLASVDSPTAPGVRFDLDERGLVRPTTAGTLNPDGVLVYLGRPDIVPPATPARVEPDTEIEALRKRLAGFRPRLRPDDLVEQAERTSLGGRSLAELSTLRPKLRPSSVQELAEQAEAEAETAQAPAEEDNGLSTATERAVATAPVPKDRPRNFAALVRKSQRSDEDRAGAAAGIAPRTVKPSIPSSTSVARQATLENALNLREINLIGVYGTASDRRALIRLPSGRYKKVKVGDKVDGGEVIAIGDSELRYQKRGRNMTLRIPNG